MNNGDNIYVFQSKNPEAFKEHFFPTDKNVFLGTTIECIRLPLMYDFYNVKAPNRFKRMKAIKFLSSEGYNTFISIEPILEFCLPRFVKEIKEAKPLFVTIGADSKAYRKGVKLFEPTWEEVEQLIQGIENSDIEVRQKKNLLRLKINGNKI